MNKFTSTLCAVAMSLSPITFTPVIAAPINPIAQIGFGTPLAAEDDLVQVQHGRRHNRDGRWDDRRGYNPYGYDNRHRRSQSYRAPRRQSSGPDLGSAIVGAIIGGIIVNQVQQSRQFRAPAGQSRIYLSQNHVNWCVNRWRSYRASDNSYQPYNGPRRICNSPYGPS